jgi:O-antigen/teichoic acid export membrane protein
MGIVIRQSIKGTAASYLGVGVGFINILFLSTAYLNPTQIGLTSVLISAASLFAFFMQLSINNVAVRYFPFFDDKAHRHQGFLNLLLIVPVLGFVVVGLLLYIFRQPIANQYIERAKLFTEYFYLVPILAILMAYIMVLEAYARVSVLRITVPVLFRELGIRLMATLALVLYAFSIINFDMYVKMLVLAYSLQVLALIAYLKYQKQWFVGGGLPAIPPHIRPEMLRYAGWLLLGSMGTAVTELIDRFMLGSMQGLAQAGIFTLGNFIAIVVEMPRRSMALIISPLVAKAWKENDMAEISMLYKKSAMTQLLAGGAVFLLIWCNLDSLFALLPNGKVYETSRYVVLFLGLAKLFDMATGANSEIINNSVYYRFNFVALVLLAVMVIAANFILIPLYSYTGAAMATAFCVFCFNVLKGSFLWYKVGIQPFSRNTLWVLCALCVVGAVGCGLPTYNATKLGAIWSIGYKSVAIAVALGGAVVWLGVLPEATQALQKWRNKN